MIRLSTHEQRVVPVWLQNMYKRILDEIGRAYSYTSGNYALIMREDIAAVRAAHIVPNFYPGAVADTLYDKALLPDYLGQFGFNMLNTRQVMSVADIAGMTNFILKPQRGAFGFGSNFRNKQNLSYRKYTDVAALLADVPQKQADSQLALGFVAQEADMQNVTDEMGLHGTVNSTGDIYWCRTSVGQWSEGQQLFNTRSWGGFANERALLQAFVKSVGIRNASFNLHFLNKGGILYPVDWNLRLGFQLLIAARDTDYREIKRATEHQFDVASQLPDEFPGTWHTTGWVNDKILCSVRP